MSQFIILADDLSGAAELAGLAYDYGHTAEVQRHFNPSASASTIAIDTASRQLTPQAASASQRAVAGQLGERRQLLLYKKTDSLLRGNVRAEIEAILQPAGYRRCILAPANPSRGRTIRGGQYFVDGQPLNQTPLASDPHHPRHSANVIDLLGPGSEPLHVVPPNSALPSTGIIIPSVETGDDLTHLASQVDEYTLPAGAADFFGALLNVRPRPSHPSNPCPIASLMKPPVLLVCGSQLSWPMRRQMALAANIPVFEAATGFGVMHHAPASALGFGDHDVSPETALWAITSLAAQLIPRLETSTVLVEGGETAAALAEKLEWAHFQVVATVPFGVGALRPVADHSPLLLIKPGSYPWPAPIWDRFVAAQA